MLGPADNGFLVFASRRLGMTNVMTWGSTSAPREERQSPQGGNTSAPLAKGGEVVPAAGRKGLQFVLQYGCSSGRDLNLNLQRSGK